MDLIQWIRSEHRGFRAVFENTIPSVVPPEQMSVRPGGQGNSIAWLMWHLARTEDMLINALIRGVPQILLRDNWGERLGFADARTGTAFGDDEVEAFSRAIDPAPLDEYWRAVHAETSDWIEGISPDDLEARPDVDERLRDVPPPITAAVDQGIVAFWRGRRASFFLGFSVIGHGYMHVGEMQAVRGRLGLPGII